MNKKQNNTTLIFETPIDKKDYFTNEDNTIFISKDLDTCFKAFVNTCGSDLLIDNNDIEIMTILQINSIWEYMRWVAFNDPQSQFYVERKNGFYVLTIY